MIGQSRGPADLPERIYDWQHSPLSIARHYGSIRIQGAEYRIDYSEPGQPLVRADVLERERAQRKADNAAIRADRRRREDEESGKQGGLLG